MYERGFVTKVDGMGKVYLNKLIRNELNLHEWDFLQVFLQSQSESDEPDSILILKMKSDVEEVCSDTIDSIISVLEKDEDHYEQAISTLEQAKNYLQVKE